MHKLPKDDALLIGIIGSNGKTSTASLLTSIFANACLKVLDVRDENNVIQNGNVTNYAIHKVLKNMKNNDIIIIELSENILKNIQLYNLYFDIIIHTNTSEGSYESCIEGIEKINFMLNKSTKNKIILLNTDDPNWKDIIFDVENTYLITYGLGNKATVTASSIEDSKFIKYCYCLQRSVNSLSGNVIEPMELPLQVKALGQYNIYNGLASITTALISGINISLIKKSLESDIKADGGIKLIYENGFGVVDNVCKNILSFETGFEAVQNLPYKNISLLFSFDNRNQDLINKKMLDTIGLWSLTLKLKNVYCMNDNNIMSKDYFEAFIDNLLKNNINYSTIKGTQDEIEFIINDLNENDLLLFFCANNLSFSREKLVEILDRRILDGI